MKTHTARQTRRQPALAERTSRRDLAASSPDAAWNPPMSAATHDFLVPNPRPDLTLEPHTLRMFEGGSFA